MYKKSVSRTTKILSLLGVHSGEVTALKYYLEICGSSLVWAAE
jgi:hypothetical protein